MIVSVHIADIGFRAVPRFLRSKGRLMARPGAIYAEPVLTAPLDGGLLPRPRLGRVGLIAAWSEDAALEAFLREDPVARRLAGGWHVCLQPLRVFGSWAGLPGLPSQALPAEEDQPAVALTLGRLRPGRARPFLLSAAPAEEEAVSHPGLLASTGFARPPRLVSTFSIWRTLGEMREYAFGASGAHQAAVRADRERPFHRESAFIRFRPLSSDGVWGGRNPLGPGLRRWDGAAARGRLRADAAP